MIDPVSRVSEALVGEEQRGVRKGRGCVDQTFVLRQVEEKALEK